MSDRRQRPLGTETTLSAQIDAKRTQFAYIELVRVYRGTRSNAGIPRLLERFRSMTENRGVPGSSPGLAIGKAENPYDCLILSPKVR